VLTNLQVNAAQAIDRQGDITVRSWQEGESLCVAVSDNGAGIPEQVRQRIFDPFFTTKEVGKGTGLGLSISYEIVKNHGGEILVSSSPGAGATFTVRLPLVQLSSAVAESGLSEWWQNA
ncbi:MAG: ATP-binding protein, partial [Desulfuromonadales bacterium]|nr:ATP-binding protein [Desulfuromonadales bacterium]